MGRFSLRLRALGLAALALGCHHDAMGPSGPDLRNHIVFISYRDRGLQAYVMRPDGSEIRALTTGPGAVGHAKLSPDRTRLAYDLGSDIYVLDLRDSSLVNLTASVAGDIEAAWSPDGRQLVFVSNRDGPLAEVYVMNADGSNPRRLTTDTADERRPAWSPDGKWILFSFELGDTVNLYVMDPTGGQLRNLTPGVRVAGAGAWSHDGTKIAYSVQVPDTVYLFTMNADGSNKRQLWAGINPGSPDWSPDDRELIFDGNGPLNIDLFIMGADGTGLRNITNDRYFNVQPQWIP